MIGYVTLGTNDIARAARFYDALLAELGAKRAMETERFIAWAAAPGGPMLSVIEPYDEQPAIVGNGVMVALAAGSKAHVDAIHRRALELGGRDDGAPGPRGDGFCAGYFHDLDGNKLDAFFLG